MSDSSQKIAFKGMASGIGQGDYNAQKLAAKFNIKKESLGLFLAEFVSMGVSLGVVAVADDIAPNLINKASKVVAKVCIRPFLNTIEAGINWGCQLRECQIDYTKTPDERAEQYAHFCVIFGSAFIPSMIAKVGTRMAMNRILEVPHTQPLTGNWFKDHIVPSKHDWQVILRDEGIHLGAIAAMNTVFAQPTDYVLSNTKSVLQKTCGFSEEKSKRLAEMFVIWELPNWLGFAAGVRQIRKHHMQNLGAPQIG